MRWKIIAVNSVVVLLVGLLSFALLRASLGDLASNQERQQADAEHALAAANAKLELDALRTERWLANAANDKASRDPFKAGTPAARAEGATELANKVRGAALGYAGFAKMPPSLVALVDASGIVLGRDGTNLMRGEDIGAAHPTIKSALQAGVTASDLWADAKSAELALVSYAPVRDDNGAVLGLIVLGTPLNDERLQRTSELTSGRTLLLGIPAGQNLELKAKSTSATAALVTALGSGATKDAALATVGSGHGSILPGGPQEFVLAAAPLSGYGDGRRAVVVAVSPSSLIESVNGLLWPIFAVTGLGILLVAVGGWLLGNYLSRPVEEIEEGLLAILNGKTDFRFEIEHPDLGGLVFRLNSLLNQLMGVQEDDTDEEGRPSRPGNPSDYAAEG